MPGQAQGPRPVTYCLPLYLHRECSGICAAQHMVWDWDHSELCTVGTSLWAPSSLLLWESLRANRNVQECPAGTGAAAWRLLLTGEQGLLQAWEMAWG